MLLSGVGRPDYRTMLVCDVGCRMTNVDRWRDLPASGTIFGVIETRDSDGDQKHL